MTIVEKMARSDAEFDGRDFDGLSRADKNRYMARCATALKAIREPEVGVKLAGVKAYADRAGICRPVALVEAFTAMIDHAIQEHEG